MLSDPLGFMYLKERKDTMSTLTQTVRLKSRLGLHMRPAAKISKLAYGFESIVAFHKGDRIAHAHSVVELLTLGISHGDEIKMTAIGADAEKALATIAEFVESFSDDSSPGDLDTAAA